MGKSTWRVTRENFLLAIAELRLGACWVGGYREDELAAVLGLPAYVRLIGLVPVGYPAERRALPCTAYSCHR